MTNASGHGRFRWWHIANERRHRLIVKQHKGGGLDQYQARELLLLTKVCDAVVEFDMDILILKLAAKKGLDQTQERKETV